LSAATNFHANSSTSHEKTCDPRLHSPNKVPQRIARCNLLRKIVHNRQLALVIRHLLDKLVGLPCPQPKNSGSNRATGTPTTLAWCSHAHPEAARSSDHPQPRPAGAAPDAPSIPCSSPYSSRQSYNGPRSHRQSSRTELEYRGAAQTLARGSAGVFLALDFFRSRSVPSGGFGPRLLRLLPARACRPDGRTRARF